MTYLKFLLAGFLVALAPSLAAANTTTFSVTGSFEFPGGSLSGTLTLDDTTGLPTAEDLTVSGVPVFDNLESASGFAGSYTADFGNSEGDDLNMTYTLSPNAPSDPLVSGLITSGDAETDGNPCDGQYDAGCFDLAGSMTAIATSDVATPLPATLPLFAGGLGVLALLAGRRKRVALAVVRSKRPTPVGGAWS